MKLTQKLGGAALAGLARQICYLNNARKSVRPGWNVFNKRADAEAGAHLAA